MENASLTAIAGITTGHVTDEFNLTGVTVVRFAGNGARAAISVQGAAPGTRETDLLEPGNLVERVHAIVLTGGSAYGLDAASGVMAALEEEGIGLPVFEDTVVPIVPAAVLFDLSVGSSTVRPDNTWGYKAAKEATLSVTEGMWLANFVFLPIAIILLYNISKENTNFDLSSYTNLFRK